MVGSGELGQQVVGSGDGMGQLGMGDVEGRRTTSGLAQEDADGAGRGTGKVPCRGPDGMTRDQLMARGWRPHLLNPATTTLQYFTHWQESLRTLENFLETKKKWFNTDRFPVTSEKSVFKDPKKFTSRG